MSAITMSRIERRRLFVAIGFTLSFLASSEARSEETIALVGGRVLTMTQGILEVGTVVVRGERIVEVTAGTSVPADARTIDVSGMIVMPGMIDSFTHLGLVEVSMVSATSDIVEGIEPAAPQMRVIDALNPNSELIPVARTTGVTTVLCAPGEGNVISGQSALIDLSGDHVDAMTVKFPVGMHANLGEAAKHPSWKESKPPQTRMGIAAILRQTIVDTQNYMRKWEEYEKKGARDEKDPPGRDLRMEAMIPVLRGEIPLVVRAHRLDDIQTALRIADEFGICLILNHATEGYKIADELARRKIPVLLGPVTTQPSSMERLGAIYENAAILSAAGVKIALQSAESHNVRILPYHAGLAVAYGLPREEALKAVTIYPAEIFGVADFLGSLEAGKIANVAVFDGDPLEPRSRLVHLMIHGREVDLQNRQTELFERYLAE